MYAIVERSALPANDIYTVEESNKVQEDAFRQIFLQPATHCVVQPLPVEYSVR